MEVSEAKRLRELEAENTRLRSGVRLGLMSCGWLSQRRAYRLLGLARSVARYQAIPRDDEPLRAPMSRMLVDELQDAGRDMALQSPALVRPGFFVSILDSSFLSLGTAHFATDSRAKAVIDGCFPTSVTDAVQKAAFSQVVGVTADIPQLANKLELRESVYA